jgi:hypothetical protein
MLKPDSTLTYFTFLRIVRPSWLIHLRDSTQNNGISFCAQAVTCGTRSASLARWAATISFPSPTIAHPCLTIVTGFHFAGCRMNSSKMLDFLLPRTPHAYKGRWGLVLLLKTTRNSVGKGRGRGNRLIIFLAMMMVFWASKTRQIGTSVIADWCWVTALLYVLLLILALPQVCGVPHLQAIKLTHTGRRICDEDL